MAEERGEGEDLPGEATVPSTHIRFPRKPLVRVGLVVFGLLLVGVLALYVWQWVAFDPVCCAPEGMGMEREAVQTAMNSMMTENALVSVTANETGAAVNTWSGFPKGEGVESLERYIKDGTTTFYYCWDSKGEVWGRNENGQRPTEESAGKPGECNPLP